MLICIRIQIKSQINLKKWCNKINFGIIRHFNDRQITSAFIYIVSYNTVFVLHIGELEIRNSKSILSLCMRVSVYALRSFAFDRRIQHVVQVISQIKTKQSGRSFFYHQKKKTRRKKSLLCISWFLSKWNKIFKWKSFHLR